MITLNKVKIVKSVAIVMGLTTLFVTPRLTFDPVNLPKLFVLIILGVSLIPVALNSVLELRHSHKLDFFILSILFFIITLMICGLTNGRASLTQQLWGVFGRNTGFVCYFSLFVLSITLYRLSTEESTLILLKIFRITSYSVTFYAVVQFANLDPIKWQTRGQVGFSTLGNINFSSALFGVSIVYFFALIASRNLPISTLVFYSVMILIDSLIIWFSGSLQGLLIAVFGIWMLVGILIYTRKQNIYLKFTFFGSSFLSVLAGIPGLFGFGPLSSILRQETMIFRSDYWYAAISMMKKYPINGIGLDSFGDYYRRFRSAEAVTRTEAGRVSDTAHNVFLDVGSGAGIFAGILLVLIFSVVFFKLLRIVCADFRSLNKNSNIRSDAAWLKFCTLLIYGSLSFQLLFSINQIGLAVWTWGFLGIAAKFSRSDFNSQDTKTYTLKENRSRVNMREIAGIKFRISRNYLLSTILMSIVIWVYFFPVLKSDHEFSVAYKEGNIKALSQILRHKDAPAYYGEVALELCVQSSLRNESLELARYLTQKYPNRFYPWYVLFAHVDSTDIERQSASKMLQFLDPQNFALKSEILLAEANRVEKS